MGPLRLRGISMVPLFSHFTPRLLQVDCLPPDVQKPGAKLVPNSPKRRVTHKNYDHDEISKSSILGSSEVLSGRSWRGLLISRLEV
jgi:hypothetical protein